MARQRRPENAANLLDPCASVSAAPNLSRPTSEGRQLVDSSTIHPQFIGHHHHRAAICWKVEVSVNELMVSVSLDTTRSH
jgi:hypothetical protein